MQYSINITMSEKAKRTSQAFRSPLDHRAYKDRRFSEESTRDKKYKTREIIKSGSRSFPVIKCIDSIHQFNKDLNALEKVVELPSFAHNGRTSIKDARKKSRPNIVIFYPIFKGTLAYFSGFKRIFKKSELLFCIVFSVVYLISSSSSATDCRSQSQELVRESQSQRESNLKDTQELVDNSKREMTSHLRQAQEFVDSLTTETPTQEFSIESKPSPAQIDPWGETPVSEFSESNDQAKTEPMVLETIPDQREGETCCGVPKSLQRQEKPALDSKSVTRGEGEFLIFVSFSLSDQALKNLYEESLRLKARLILKGLHENSFQETRKKVQHLGIQADIDPTLYEKHAVKVVPTFILEKGDKADKVAGNITAQEALSILQGDAE